MQYPISLRAQSARVLHWNRSVLRSRKEWESEKGADHSRPCITWISQKASRPALFPPQCQIRTRIRVADASAAVVHSGAVQSGVPGLLTKGGAKGSLLCTHTVYTHTHTLEHALNSRFPAANSSFCATESLPRESRLSRNRAPRLCCQ